MTDSESVTPAQAGPAVVALPVEIDLANARQVRQQLYSALATGVAVVVADMTATTFCDSMGCRSLVMAHKQARAGNAELRLAIPSASVLRVMAITCVDRVVRIYPSLDAALAGRPMGKDRRRELERRASRKLIHKIVPTCANGWARVRIPGSLSRASRPRVTRAAHWDTRNHGGPQCGRG
jgi:anti-sigma B factor antagonist